MKCHHCGSDCEEIIPKEGYNFCCNGCVSVYTILNNSPLSGFYDLEDRPGIKVDVKGKNRYEFLKTASIEEDLIQFKDDVHTQIEFYIPPIHCSSCIWLLENLNQLNPHIDWVRVNFPKKKALIQFRHQDLSLFQLVELLDRLGYGPYISLDDQDKNTDKSSKIRLYKLAVAGFFWGNTMFIAFPDYFASSWEHTGLREFFGIIGGLFSIPVLLYSASDYFKSAWAGIRSRYFNMDVPIALGLIVLFISSWYDVLSQGAPGYFDSLTALVFFLLLGKMFQDKTYHFLSFERDYKSYFPISITRIKEGKEENIPLRELEKGDRILIRNEELIPADAVLIKGEGLVDNSFVTGESRLIDFKEGDKIFAGGKQKGAAILLEVLSKTDQSYLTRLWSHESFQKKNSKNLKSFTDRISKHFTLTLILIASLSLVFWLFYSPEKAFQVFAAVLIVACPCALALAAPFTHGNALRILASKGFFIKDALSLERMSEVDQLIFDKTGTLTISNSSDVDMEQAHISEQDLPGLKNLSRQSNHPVSRMICDALPDSEILDISNFDESTNLGAQATVLGKLYKIGLAPYVGRDFDADKQTRLYWSVDGEVKGSFQIKNQYRNGVDALVNKLKKDYSLALLSGDTSGEQERLQHIFGKETPMSFNASPHDKLEFVRELQKQDHQVLMIGDGLNDAGALQQSEVGMSISENINSFSPACDVILQAEKLNSLDKFLQYARTSKRIIYWSFAFSFAYNIVGLSFAVAGKLSPLVSAILMPLSSISVVLFATAATSIAAKKILKDS
jgi:Cu+-exporting ATPase